MDEEQCNLIVRTWAQCNDLVEHVNVQGTALRAYGQMEISVLLERLFDGDETRSWKTAKRSQ